MDKSTIHLAGVVSGAKMFVRPVDGAAGPAVAVAADQNTNANI